MQPDLGKCRYVCFTDISYFTSFCKQSLRYEELQSLPMLGVPKPCSSFSPHFNSTPLEESALTAVVMDLIPTTITFLEVKPPHTLCTSERDAGDVRLVAFPGQCLPLRCFYLLQASLRRIGNPESTKCWWVLPYGVSDLRIVASENMECVCLSRYVV